MKHYKFVHPYCLLCGGRKVVVGEDTDDGYIVHVVFCPHCDKPCRVEIETCPLCAKARNKTG